MDDDILLEVVMLVLLQQLLRLRLRCFLHLQHIDNSAPVGSDSMLTNYYSMNMLAYCVGSRRTP